MNILFYGKFLNLTNFNIYIMFLYHTVKNKKHLGDMLNKALNNLMMSLLLVELTSGYDTTSCSIKSDSQ